MSSIANDYLSYIDDMVYTKGNIRILFKSTQELFSIIVSTPTEHFIYNMTKDNFVFHLQSHELSRTYTINNYMNMIRTALLDLSNITFQYNKLIIVYPVDNINITIEYIMESLQKDVAKLMIDNHFVVQNIKKQLKNEHQEQMQMLQNQLNKSLLIEEHKKEEVKSYTNVKPRLVSNKSILYPNMKRRKMQGIKIL